MWIGFALILGLFPLLNAQSIAAPYQVSIRTSDPTIMGAYTTSEVSKQICNGVIIRDKYILTTASCLFVHDLQNKNSRLINPGEIFVTAGNISLNQAHFGDEVKGSFRRNVVTVISNGKYNATTGEYDIAILKLDRSLLPLTSNNTSPVRWIELEQHRRSVAPSQQQTTATLAPTNNKVNENCFVNIYNNSVGAANYPYTIVRNVSFFEKWVCDTQRGSLGVGQTVVERNGSCLGYPLSNPQTCWLDANSLRRSEERGTALVCNFKLVAILAEINPPANPHNCASIKRTTAYYTMVAPHYEWIVSEIGYLYNLAPSGSNGTKAGSSNQTGPLPPVSSWGEQQVVTTVPGASGKSKSSASPSISTGVAYKFILLSLFIPFALMYRFHE
ncbi:uncharacterized protein LOC134212101 [Armigeres subalbatus]|uniref:uncharacterized protein LOC134212101 n=1 Tax=Armigeres subalbatus TaxID=124917 RepID=UPI002ED0B071